jgi:hypothetical protein
VPLNLIIGCDVASDRCYPRFTFYPGSRATPCDLDPETVYNLVLDGLSVEGGAVLDAVTITFTTGTVPDGYTPDYCSEQVDLWWIMSGNSLDVAAGMVPNYLVAFPPYPFIDAYGVEADSPYYGYNTPGLTEHRMGYMDGAGNYFPETSKTGNADNHTPMLEIYTPFGEINLSAVVDSVLIQDLDGNTINVALPGDTVPQSTPANMKLLLYVGADGSSYYAKDGSTTGDIILNTDSYGDGGCDSVADNCPILTPAEAFQYTPAATWP